jgi:hypothetical protein
MAALETVSRHFFNQPVIQPVMMFNRLRQD